MMILKTMILSSFTRLATMVFAGNPSSITAMPATKANYFDEFKQRALTLAGSEFHLLQRLKQ